MGRSTESLVFLDTHIVVWLYDALEDKFTPAAKDAINQNQIGISALVRLELQYLFEIKKIKTKPEPIIASLSESIGLMQPKTNFNKLVEVSLALNWTRDPFDRLLTAQAQLHNSSFITADRLIRKNYPLCIW